MKIFKTTEEPKVVQKEKLNYVCELCNTCYDRSNEAENCETLCKQKQCKHKFTARFFYDQYETYGFGGYILDKINGKCSKCGIISPEFNISREGEERIDRILDRELTKHLKKKV